MGGKKATVSTMAISSLTRNTAASSLLSRPTSRSGCASARSPPNTSWRSPGPIFDAQPAQAAELVSRISFPLAGSLGLVSMVIRGASSDGFDARSNGTDSAAMFRGRPSGRSVQVPDKGVGAPGALAGHGHLGTEPPQVGLRVHIEPARQHVDGQTPAGGLPEGD